MVGPKKTLHHSMNGTVRNSTAQYITIHYMCHCCPTAGEMMVGPKKTLFMDEISTGLDSSTTFQIVKCMGDFVHLREGTVLMSLLQPAPEVYNLFDDVLLLSEGELPITQVFCSLCWAGLGCAVLCCAVLCCAVLCCAVLCCVVCIILNEVGLEAVLTTRVVQYHVPWTYRI